MSNADQITGRILTDLSAELRDLFARFEDRIDVKLERLRRELLEVLKAKD